MARCARCAFPMIPGRPGRRSNCSARDLSRPSQRSSPSRRPMSERPRSAISVFSVPNIATRCGEAPPNGSRRGNSAGYAGFICLARMPFGVRHSGMVREDLRCAIAHRGILGFRVRCFAAPRNDGVWIASRSLSSGARSRLASLLEQVSADQDNGLGRGVLGPVVNIGAFGKHLASFIDPVGPALAVLGQASLHDVSQRRTLLVAMKGGNSARFYGYLPDAHLTLRKVIQPLLAEREA